MDGEPAQRPLTVDAAQHGLSVRIRASRYLGAAVVATMALSLANCGQSRVSGRHASELKYGVSSSPRVIPEGQPIPKGGGRDMVGKPYVVAGRTYVPHPGKGYDREGWASWYGSAFHGRLTANGEVFDRASIAAAHPTLPLPSYVRVTNLVNNRSMVVRVNDRGPYERDRVIDLSERAADALGFHRKGTGRVRVQYVGRASLGGSDDEKLLATLRTDGLPAHLTPQTQVASGGPGEGRGRADDRTPERAPIKVASARQVDDEDDDVTPGPRGIQRGGRAPESPRLHSARLQEDDDPTEVMPPRRPDFRRSN